jgi:hypothetical protein
MSTINSEHGWGRAGATRIRADRAATTKNVAHPNAPFPEKHNRREVAAHKGAGGDVDVVYKRPCELSFAALPCLLGLSKPVLRSVQNLCHSAKSLMLSKESSD